jgi:protein involved in polysaccharide export with SLBB domain
MISTLMKFPRYVIAALFCASLLFAGCATIGQPAGAKADGKRGAASVQRIPLRAGDTVKVVLVPPPRGSVVAQAEDFKVTIKEDGTIALPYFPAIPAAGKTTQELEKDIHDRYVPDYYKSLGVTVEPDARFIYVGGEVVKSGRIEYIGAITVTQAIQSAQGCTDYANRKKIKLIRSTGKTETINWNTAIDHPEKDPQVYPGDKIEVLRRWL